MTRPPACEYGPSGYCANGAHGSCAHRAGGPVERGSWAPECYLTIPPKIGNRGNTPIPNNFESALVIPGRGTSVIRPSHVWHCPCACHRGELTGQQLDLFGVAS